MGSLATVPAPRLGATAAKAAFQASGLSPEVVTQTIVGTVLPAAQGQAPARQVAIYSEVPTSAPALTINKVCGSGLKSLHLAAEQIQLGKAECVLAGGIENMSLAPYYLTTARDGFRMGHQQAIDGMIHDGLWDCYNNFHMGNAAELCAKEYRFSREEQDQFAKESYERALQSQKNGDFREEIAAVEVPFKKEKILVADDEEPGRGRLDKFSSLRPAFDKEGSITAANASSINDGAAMLLLGGASLSAKPLARILHTAEFAHQPEWFTTAPVSCVKKLLDEAELKVSDIASFEINEAFAVVAMAAQKDLGIPREKLNPRGGAVAIGHPIGASGARLMTTLIHTLKPQEKGVVSLCIGGGEAIACLIERL